MPTEQPPVAEPAPVASPLPADSGSLLSRIRVSGRDPVPTAAVEPEPPKPDVEPVPEPTPTPEPEPKKEPTEPAKEPVAPKPEPPKEEPTTGMSEKAATRFKTLERHKLQAEQERDTARKELDEVRKKAEAAEAQLREVETIRSNAAKMERELQQYRDELRTTNLERDPEFQKRYNGQILSRQEQMLEMATEAGVDRNQIISAMNAGDDDALSDIRDSLPRAKQLLWDANRVDIERLALERRQALKNSKQTAEQIEDDRRKQFAADEQRRAAQNVTTAKAIVGKLWEDIPGLDQAGVEVREEIESWLSDQVVNAPADQLMRNLAIGQIATKVTEGQKVEIERLAAEMTAKDQKIAELEEKLSEQETFIKEVSSRSPRPSLGGGNPPAATENGSLLSKVRVHVPGR